MGTQEGTQKTENTDKHIRPEETAEEVGAKETEETDWKCQHPLLEEAAKAVGTQGTASTV